METFREMERSATALQGAYSDTQDAADGGEDTGFALLIVMPYPTSIAGWTKGCFDTASLLHSTICYNSVPYSSPLAQGSTRGIHNSDGTQFLNPSPARG